MLLFDKMTSHFDDLKLNTLSLSSIIITPSIVLIPIPVKIDNDDEDEKSDQKTTNTLTNLNLNLELSQNNTPAYGTINWLKYVIINYAIRMTFKCYLKNIPKIASNKKNYYDDILK